jgi:plastocyanin
MKKAALVAIAALAMGAVVAPAAAGPEGHAAKVGAKVKVKNFEYVPKRVRIRSGRRVVWKSTEGTHTVTIKGTKFDKTISGGDRVTKRFRKRGRYRYFCRFHKSLGHKGVVVVK